MDEPGKGLEVAVPGRLARLAQIGYTAPADLGVAVRRYSTHPFELDVESGLSDLGPTDESRIRRTLRAETAEPGARYMRPNWVESEEGVPGLIISLRYSQQDAHGIAQRIRDLDMAFRRAAATLETYQAGERNTGWAYPMRPERGGLWVLDSRRGSYELLATVYGSLVIWASSTPISLAALASLAWDSSVRASRVGRWTVNKFHKSPEAGPPSLGSGTGDATWGLKQTKALEPVMLEAAKAGSGLEYINNSALGEVRLTIYPNTELTTDDD